jgi:cysteine desulfurase family protein (TIGR01976 family)
VSGFDVAQVRGFDVAHVRGLYPTLGSGTSYLEGSLAALQPESVVRAVISSLRSAPAQPGSWSARSRLAQRSAELARQAIADLTGGAPQDVALGGNVADLMLRLVTVLAEDWQLGDEIVLNRFDSDLYLRTWRRHARDKGVVVRWAEVDLESGELPAWQYERLIGPRTRIVTVALGNPITGTVPDLYAIAQQAHRRGALVIVDASAAVNHLPLDLADFDVDVLLLSAAAFGGPSAAAFVMRPGLRQELDAITANFEPGSLPIELLDGVTAAVDHLAALDQAASGSRRNRLLHSVSTAGEHTSTLQSVLADGLGALRGVTVIGTSSERLPITSFTVEGRHPHQVADALAARRLSVWTGPIYLTELATSLGLDDVGGAVHVGLMPYNNRGDVDRLLQALVELVGGG